MAYVSVPKDLTKVKNKVAFNLTKRQLICIGIGAAMGIPSYSENGEAYRLESHRISKIYLPAGKLKISLRTVI